MNEDMLAELQAEFVGEARELLETLQDRTMALSESAEKSVLDEIFRVLHNLKGTSQSVELPEFSSFVHKIEDQVQAVRANFVEGEAVAGDFIQFLLKSHDEVLNLVRKLEAGEKLTPEDLTGVPEAPKLDEQRPAVDGEVGNNEVQIAQGPEPALNSSFEQPMSSTDEDSLISEDLAAQSDEVSAQPLQTEKATSTAGASKSKAIKTQQFVKCPTSKISTMLNYLGETITLVNQIN
ncbi:MAG: Hpt domain-containing protein, partial [Bdellovibrionales bacterium]|nr:Hpt domain-containing protein [Bdellovibrionales bacterium]